MDTEQFPANFSALTEVPRRLDRRMKEHPYVTLAAAVGVGYVLAGGLFTRLTARLLKVAVAAGAPLALGPLLEKELTGGSGVSPVPRGGQDEKR